MNRKLTIDEDTTDYLIRAERAATGLRKAGETITDNLFIAMILKGLPESFKPFVVVHTQLDKYKTLSAFEAALNNYSNTEAIRSTQEQSSSMASKTRKPQECNHTIKKGQFSVYRVQKRGTNQRIAAQNQSYNANFVNDRVT